VCDEHEGGIVVDIGIVNVVPLATCSFTGPKANMKKSSNRRVTTTIGTLRELPISEFLVLRSINN
jgi:hypothetical protein